jgi:hypothetical protein
MFGGLIGVRVMVLRTTFNNISGSLGGLNGVCMEGGGGGGSFHTIMILICIFHFSISKHEYILVSV